MVEIEADQHAAVPDEQTQLLPKPNGVESEDASSRVEAIAAEGPSTARLVVILLSTWIGVFLAALDMTVIATLLTPISSSFQSFSSASWIATAYFIATSSTQPLYGRLTDIFGRQAGALFCNTAFATGTLLCGIAKSEGMLIGGRVVAGIGGGGLTTIATIIASDLVPLRKRGLVQGGGNIAYGTGFALGGWLGGLINDTWGWRMAFLAQLPLIAISTIGVLVFAKIPMPATDGQSITARLKRIDFLGSLTLVLTLVLLLLPLNTGGAILPWTHPLILTSLPLSALFLALFIYTESRHAAEPTIPLRLLAHRTVAAACTTNWFLSASVFALLFYAPLYLQLRSYTPAQAGLRLAPQALGISLGSLACGALMRATGRYYALALTTLALYVAAASAIALFFDLHTPDAAQIAAMTSLGFGYASMLTTTLVAIIAAVPAADQAVATSASYAFRATGSTLGVAAAGAAFQAVLAAQLSARLGGRGPEAAEVIERVRRSLEYVKEVPEEWRADVLAAGMAACRVVFALGAGLGAAGWASAALMREHVLSERLDRG